MRLFCDFCVSKSVTFSFLNFFYIYGLCYAMLLKCRPICLFIDGILLFLCTQWSNGRPEVHVIDGLIFASCEFTICAHTASILQILPCPLCPHTATPVAKSWRRPWQVDITFRQACSYPLNPSEGCYQFRCLTNTGTIGVNSLTNTVTPLRRCCDLNP